MSPAEKDAIRIYTLENTTVLSAFKKINIDFPEAKCVFDWFGAKEIGSALSGMPFEWRATEYFSGNGNKEFALSFLKNADFSISEVNFKKRNVPLPKVLSPESNGGTIEPNKDVSVLIGISEEEVVKPEFSHFYTNKDGKTEHAVLPMEDESSGTLRAFGLAAPIHQLLTEGGILMIDEIETSLHPRIVEYLLLVFLVNSKDAQLVFTTHNTSLMQADFMRPDVIWFTEKNEAGATELYALDEFNDVKMAKVKGQYEAGRFGAYPHVWNYKLDLTPKKEE